MGFPTLIETFDEHFGVFLMSLIFATAVIITVVKTIANVLTTASRERSRREIAAYVAEGNISPEQAERLLKASVDGRSV